MTDTDDVALLELQVAVLLILHFIENTFAFSWQFLSFHSMAVLIQYPLVTDRQTHDDNKYRASIASCGAVKITIDKQKLTPI